MSVLFYGITIFLFAFLLHLIIWKIRLPANQTRSLLAIFFSTLILSIVIFTKFSSHIKLLNIDVPYSIFEYMQLNLLVASLTLAYIVTYSALEVDSPSLVMVTNIAKAGFKGLEKNSLEETMDDELLILPRLSDLLKSGMLHLEEGKYKLRPKGTLLARIFVFYRGLLNAGKGG